MEDTLLFLIYEYFRVIGENDAVVDCTDLISISLQGDDVQDFDTRWDQALSSTQELPKYSVLFSVYKMRTRKCDQLRTVLAMCEQEIHQDRSRPNLSGVKTMVRRYTDQIIRARKFTVRNERVETGVLVKTQNA